MNRKKDLFYIIAGLVFFIIIGIILERARLFAPLKEEVRSRSVPSGLLNYGAMGKILKRLGVVMAVPNDYARFPASKTGPPAENAPVFQKKRRVGQFLYRTNPGGQKEIPSSLIIKEEHHKKGWPLLSVTVSKEDLYHPDRGIISNHNGKGRKWERLAYVSYFEESKLLFATAAGLRLHGGYIRNPPKHWEKVNYSFRLYFRDEYGINQFKPGLLFDADCEPVKHLVVHNVVSWQVRYTPCIAFDIARRIGCEVPQTRLTQFYLNGEPQGYYYLSEHLNKTQWVSHIGHDNFAFYRSRGGGDKGTMRDYRELEARVRNPRQKMTAKEVDKYVDIENLSRHLFSWMFCGTTDQIQGAAVLDRSQPGARWYWINWDMDQSFLNSRLRNPRLKHWQQRALPLAMGSVKNWKAGYVRQVLFTRLLMDDPEYREYFVRLTMDLLNHRLAPGFLDSLMDYYQELPIPNGSGKSYSEENVRVKKDLGRLREYMKHRPYFLRKEIQDYFNSGEIFLCRLRGAPGYRYKIDGYPEKGNYRGRYYKGKTITVELTGSQNINSFSHWLVNGKKHKTPVLSFPVNRDTVISPVMTNEALLLKAAKRGNVNIVKAILKKELETIELTYLAMIEAVEYGHEEVVKELIANGADVHAEVDKNVSLVTHALAFNHAGIVKVLRNAGAAFSLDRIRSSGQLLNNFIQLELKSPRYKELKVWCPLQTDIENISPSLYILGGYGKFSFDTEKEKENSILVVSNIEPGKEGKRSCRFGYSPKRKGLDMEIPAGRYIHFVVTAKIPERLLNKSNFLFIQDFDGEWEREAVYFSGNGWQTYMVSKKIRPQSTKLQFGFWFSPRSAEDKLIIKDVRVFVNDASSKLLFSRVAARD